MDRRSCPLSCTYDELDVGQPSKLVSVALSDAGEKVTVLASCVHLHLPCVCVPSPAHQAPYFFPQSASSQTHAQSIFSVQTRLRAPTVPAHFRHQPCIASTIVRRPGPLFPHLLLYSTSVAHTHPAFPPPALGSLKVFEGRRVIDISRSVFPVDQHNGCRSSIVAALCKEANTELPKDLLESFVAATECFEDIIQEESPSVTLHFESGRLLVVDLSDPYTSGKCLTFERLGCELTLATTAPTAAAITAVMTHTFACWNATRDKILGACVTTSAADTRTHERAVLENADAYLAAGPVLRRELAALTQRTAALNLRLLVSAHAPGPSFTQLMRDASFVVAHQHAESGPGATPLCPGEALLCSSGAVVLDNEGEPTLLGSRSLVVSVRTRMTGAPVNVPLLDASSLVEYSAPVIPPPPSSYNQSNSTSSSSSSVSSRSIPEISMPQPTRIGPDADFFFSPTTAADATPTPPAAPLGAGSGASQKARPQPPNELTRSTSNSQVPMAPPATQRQPANNTQPSSSERNGRKAAPTARDLHVPVSTTQSQSPMIWTPQQPAPGSRRDRERQHKVTMEELEEEPEFRLAQALDSAAAHILEQVASRRTTPQHTHSKLPPVMNNSRQRNSIGGPMYGAPPSIPEHPSVPSSRSSSAVSSNSVVLTTSPKRFGELVNTLENFAAHGEPRPSRTEVASAIGESYLGTGFVTFRGYTLAAEKAGLVRRGGSAQAGTEWLELVH